MCACRVTQLYRGLGAWPTTGFQTLTAEQQQEFMQSIASMTGPQTVEYANEVLETFEEHAEFYEDSGEFQPLGYYQARGYDIDAIARLTPQCDIRSHPVLGLTYRVRIYKSGRSG